MKKLCIAIPNNIETEGSFILSQIDHLKPPFILTTGFMPYKDSMNGSIFKSILKIELFRKALHLIFPKLYEHYYERALCDYLIYNQIDVILAQYGLVGANLVDSCRKTGTELVVHFHGFDAYHLKTLEKYHYQYLKMFKYSKVIAVSKHMRNKLIDLGCSYKNIFTIPYGVNPGKFFYNPPMYPSYDFIFVGRFVAKKNPIAVIRSFEIVLSWFPTASLVMIGDGPLLERCRNLANRLGISDLVTFLGKKSHNDVVKYLQISRCYVQHSVTAKDGDREGMPNSILEACSCGLPVISTNHTGIPEAITQETGYLVGEGDIVSMANYMVKILIDKSNAKKMGKAGRSNMIKNFNIHIQIEKLKNVIYESDSKNNKVQS
jgi:glycosyltransferase involved in cell wall biosynthesis